ncbi:MAG TPA: redox-regulated ATPase YchF [Patescibacteria group bacterium]|nr:redox-regulated ATPase YchF [Patescibacteria group bacterium]
MSFSIGIVGLPNVGKSTLFKAITKKQVDIANYPFCTIEPNVGIVAVPDKRLDALTKMSQSAKTIPTTIEFYDIAGLVKGAHSGEGLGNQFLSHIREVNAIVQVVRVFSDSNIIHTAGKVDPKDDMETINLELNFADQATVKKRVEALSGKVRTGSKEGKIEHDIFSKLLAHMEKGGPARDFTRTPDEAPFVKSLNLLTDKPLLYVVNVDESGPFDQASYQKYFSPNEKFIVISAKIEAELSELTPEEATMYMRDLGISESGLDRLIHASYALLGLITFITTGPEETKAWTITKGTLAPQAAGVIHTDFEQGFIRAEVIAYDDFVSCGGEAGAKEKGVFRLEGKEYVMKDGDIVHFRFA